MNNNLLSYLRRAATVSDDLWEDVYKILTRQFVRKDGFFYKPGTICPHIWYLQKGLIRIYHEYEGREVTPWIQDAEEIFIAPDSSLDRLRPTRMYIQTLEDTTAYRADVEDVEGIIKRHPKFYDHYRNINALYRRLQSEREAGLRTNDPEQRFLKLLEAHPSYFDRVRADILQQYAFISANKFYDYKRKYIA
jgi:CRP-like cAMP-binding protein